MNMTLFTPTGLIYHLTTVLHTLVAVQKIVLFLYLIIALSAGHSKIESKAAVIMFYHRQFLGPGFLNAGLHARGGYLNDAFNAQFYAPCM